MTSEKPHDSLNTASNRTNFYIVRHGQTDWNIQGKIQGQLDIPLNNRGKEEAALLAEELKKISFDACFSSDLLRAYETALILNSGNSLAIKTDQRLRERNFKTWEGQLAEEYIKAAPGKQRIVESDELMQERIFQALTEIATCYPQANVLIVTHGGVIRIILKHLLAISPHLQEIGTPNTAILKIYFSNNLWTIDEFQGIDLPTH